jgi:uncharacterized protein (DUF488 family)
LEVPKPIIYTIGHSKHPAEYFLELLQAYSVDCLVDVRSVAASRFNPQFNKARLANFLKENGIDYLHFGEEFGGRRSDPAVLDKNGRVDFEKVRKSKVFKGGMERLAQGVKKKRTIALMCGESEPLDCHRFSMITPALKEEGFVVKHILKDKSIKTNEELEGEMLAQYEKKMKKKGMLAQAYGWKNGEIGYVNLKI